jgi:hypothetical protein
MLCNVPKWFCLEHLKYCVFWLWYFFKQFADLVSYGVLMFCCYLFCRNSCSREGNDK